MPAKPIRDALGRRSRLKPISTGKRVTPQPRDLLWFEKLAEHGPLPTSFLLEFSRHTHKSQKRARERLTDLFNEDNTPHGGAYLTRPHQQFRTIDSRYNQLVYDLAPAGLAALKKAGFDVHPSRSGPWLHSFMVSCITASVELAGLERDSLRYLPQSAILARADANLRWPADVCDPDTGAYYTKDLLPDAVFGLEYVAEQGSRFRFFALEADRATEPLTSGSFHRKSYVRHLLQYEDYIEYGGYREHLNLTAPMLVLNVTTNLARMQRMLQATAEQYPDGNSYQLFQVWRDFAPSFRPPEPNRRFIEEGWARSGLEPFDIFKP
ncbi:MAG: replication-relaxation family protein [Novosphingobium sp.]|nr:replication-relaxation family protein [Novosphingobium sp.]